ncbi:MAG: hypothetical protein ACOVP8_14130, partial [Phycisphaerales bacterium]
VRSLLELGANIGMKNHWDEVPISNIQPETMEEFLNESCLKFDPKKDKALGLAKTLVGKG